MKHYITLPCDHAEGHPSLAHDILERLAFHASRGDQTSKRCYTELASIMDQVASPQEPELLDDGSPSEGPGYDGAHLAAIAAQEPLPKELQDIIDHELVRCSCRGPQHEGDCIYFQH